MNLRELLDTIRETGLKWFDALAYFVRANRGWVLTGVVIVSIMLIVWARFGFTLQFSQYYAATPPEIVGANCGVLAGPHACCVKEGQDPLKCDNAGATINFGATSDCRVGCYGNPQYCGPSVPLKGDFAWELASNNLPSCGGNVSQGTEYFVGVNVGACHPDGLHLVWRAVHRPTANCSFADGPGSVQLREGDAIRTEHTNPNVLENTWPDLEAGDARMYYKGSAANCGSVHLFGAFWADPPPEAYKHNLAGNTGYHHVINYGIDCSGAPGQVKPGGAPTGGSPGTENGGTLSVACGDDANVLSWDKGTGVQRGNEGLKNLSDCADYWCWLPTEAYNHQKDGTGLYGYIDDNLQDDTCYEYRIKLGSDVLEHSNTVICPSGCGETPEEPDTHLECRDETCTEVEGTGANECAVSSDCIEEEQALYCDPSSQSVAIGEWADLDAADGSGDYSWSAEGSPTDEDDNGDEYRVRYDEDGTYDITVSDDTSGKEDVCEVRVRKPDEVEVTITPTPPPGDGDLRMSGAIRNVTENSSYGERTTARASQQVEVRIAVQATEELPDVIVGADVPSTATYISGSTAIDGTSTAANTITTSGLALGSVDGVHSVTFRMRTKSASVLPQGTRSDTINLRADGDEAGVVTDTVTLVVNNLSQAGAAATTPTGPGDVTVVALLASALVTLLYVSYTHSGTYRSREASKISKKREPMDFQN